MNDKSDVELLFPNKGMHRNAAFIASIHPSAFEYLQQAPVLALCFGAKHNTRADRLYVAMRIGGPIERGERLRNVMNAVGIPYPLRKLKPSVLSPMYQPTIRSVGLVGNSTLSQVIPVRAGAQREWLKGLMAFRFRMALRGTIISGDDWVWLVRNYGAGDASAQEYEDFADWRHAHQLIDISKWTCERSRAEINLWHDRLAAERQVENFGGGIRSDTRIDLSDWPEHCEVNGFEFFKLSTPALLLEEGRRMRHCVGSYIRDVLNGSCSIFSIRHEMRRIATAQVVGQQVVQIKGFANKLAPEPVRTAANRFVKGLAA